MKPMERTIRLIYRVESNGDYNACYMGIPKDLRLPNDLSTYNVAAILNWQKSIRPQVASTACGALQVINKTLQSLVDDGSVSGNDMFDAATQDRCTMALLHRRGLEECATGVITVERYANLLACEWASLPCVEPFTLSGRQIKPGSGMYDGDGLNSARATPGEVIDALRSDLGFASAQSYVDATPQPKPTLKPEERVAPERSFAERTLEDIRNGFEKFENLDTSVRNDILKLMHGKIKRKSRTIRSGTHGQVAAGGIAGIGAFSWIGNLLPDEYAGIVEAVQNHAPLIIGIIGLAAFVFFGKMIRHRVEDAASGVHKGNE